MRASDRPNILLILVDELRAPRPYDPTLRFPAQERLRAQGLSLDYHYTAATACAPSRTSLFTGHYPSLHGVSQTDGMAKRAADVTWLAPDTVPTLGHYLSAAGYRTYYRGKWHISHADLLDAKGAPIATNDKDGEVLATGVAAYKAADPLRPYGFSGWIGPEPHGADPANTGYVRDPLFADQVVEQLAQLGEERKQDAPPFFFVASLVNPHDIAVYSQLWSTAWGFPWPDSAVPPIPPPPTADEDLGEKPRCQRDYVDKYWRVLLPQVATERYRRFYFWLQQLVDKQVERILDALAQAGLRESTLVLYTSDHGDMLGAHGGMHQKWHNAYEETIHVPCIVSNPLRFPAAAHTRRLTSHIDLAPTILSLAGVDAAMVQEQLRKSHRVVRPLVGRDLSALLHGSATAAEPLPQQEEAVYFMSDDQVTDGGSWLEFGALKLPYRPVIQPGYVETVVARLPAEPTPELWKYSRYFDGGTGPRKKPADELELYCLTDDPLEQRNLVARAHATPRSERARARLEELRKQYREKVRIA